MISDDESPVADTMRSWRMDSANDARADESDAHDVQWSERKELRRAANDRQKRPQLPQRQRPHDVEWPPQPMTKPRRTKRKTKRRTTKKMIRMVECTHKFHAKERKRMDSNLRRIAN